MEQDFLSPSLVMLLGVFVYGETLSAERPFVFWRIRVSLAFSPFGGMRECARRGVSDGFSDPGGGRRGMILARNGKKS